MNQNHIPGTYFRAHVALRNLVEILSGFADEA
jgi:hypothetical protein